ncbi:MAG: DUF4097 domain-containing protein [Ruminococcaceae bacterium]|nr:DUF4097 domain-containing protein [Oscillospiraceae bacterium]
MSKAAKIWLVIAAFLVLIGCILLGGAMAMVDWDLTKLSTNKYETNDYEINECYKSISVITDTADVVFVASENSKCYVSCYEQQNARHSVTVKDGTLFIELVDTRKWYEYIGINFKSPKITVYIPAGEYGALSVRSSTGDVEIPKDFKFSGIEVSESTGDVTCYAAASGDVKIKTTTGNIHVEGSSLDSLALSVSTGNVTVSDVTCKADVSVGVSTGKAVLNNVSCKHLTSTGSTGDISLNHVIAAEKISVKRATGDVKLIGSDAAEIFVETDTGSVTGTVLSEKAFIARTDTGTVDVPKTANGGRCEITTDTGDIRIDIQK